MVYRAEDTRLGRDVALKFLPEDTETDPVLLQRLRVEARAAAALNQPNIATIHAIEEVNGQTFIAMEYVTGENVRDLLETGPLEPAQAHDLITQVAHGLAAAHREGVIHRDIKSANIMVDANGRARIMDFGVAKTLTSVPSTQAGTSLGTITYMSPEQIQGADVDHRADLWSLGVVLYEMLTGELPFMADYDAALAYKILNDEPQSVEQSGYDIPTPLIAVVSQLLRKDPAKRPQSAQEVIDMLSAEPRVEYSPCAKNAIAVLYFENMSPEKENEYFCAGITEDLIIDLSHMQGLCVVPRSDVLPFRGREINRREVGRRLGASYMLEGSVRKAGNKIRITAQLVDTESGFQVWADRYDRLLEDIFEVQVDVSQKIAQAMKVSLTDAEKEAIAQRPTDDLRAYDFYMRAIDFVTRGGQRNTLAAIQMLEHAIEIDPEFALAHIALAEAYAYKYIFYDGSDEWLTKARKSSERALELDPNLAEAKFGVGVSLYMSNDFDGALANFKELIAERADYYPALRWASICCTILKKFDEAIELAKACARVKPYSEEPWVHVSIPARCKGDAETAEWATGELIKRAERIIEVNPDDAVVLSRLAANYAERGDSQKAQAALDRVIELDPEDGLCLYNCACASAIMGDAKRALRYLHSAMRKGYWNVSAWVTNDPDFTMLRGHPEFQQLLDEARKAGR